MLEYCDTHCHLHFDQYKLNTDEVIKRAIDNGVTRMVTVGTNGSDSQNAVDLAAKNESVWASVGLHPHDAKYLERDKALLKKVITQPKVVAIGECGLDYYYNHSPKDNQKVALKWQIELALEHNLPIIFHIRDAYRDFWQIVDEYKIQQAVAHCFVAGKKELHAILKHGWYVGLNGIVTFSQDAKQIEAFKIVPLNKLLLETDTPFLTPAPQRGKVNEPKNVVAVAQFLSDLRKEPLEKIVATSTKNAKQLFKKLP